MSSGMHSPSHSSSFTLHNVFTMRCLTRAVHLQKSVDQYNRKSGLQTPFILLQRTLPALCTHSSSRLRQDSNHFDVRRRHCTELCICSVCQVLEVATFPPSRVFFDKREQPKVSWRQVGTSGGMDRNLDDLVVQEGHRNRDRLGTGAITKEKCLTSDPLILSRPVD